MTTISNISNISDAELLSQYRQSGNQDLLGEIFNRYTGFVFAVCMKYLKDVENAKDASMQIFEKLVSELQKKEVDNLKPWLHVVTKNHCLMQLRSAKPHIESLQENEHFSERFMESDSVLHPDSETAEREAQLSNLESAITQLKEGQKECVQMFYIEEKCYKEIEQKTGYSYKQIKSYIQNGKRNLKNLLVSFSSIIVIIVLQYLS